MPRLSEISPDQIKVIAEPALKLSDVNPEDIKVIETPTSMLNPVRYAKEAASDFMAGIKEAPSFGLGPVIAGATGSLADTILGLNKDKSFVEKYRSHRDAEVAERDKRSARSPIAFGAGEISGALGLPIPGGVIKQAAAGAGGAAVASFGKSKADFTKGELPLDEMQSSALVAGSVPFVGKALGKLAQKTAPHLGQTLFGVRPKTVKTYMSRPNEIMRADEETLKDTIDNTISGLKKQFDDAGGVLTEEITENLKLLRKSVSEQSSKAFEVLYKLPAMKIVKTKTLLTNKLNDLRVGGREPILAAKADFDKLSKIRDYMDEIAPKGKMRPEDVKQFIQILDAEAEPVFDVLKAGGYASRGDRFLIDLRSALNEELLEIGEKAGYGKLMAPLREDTKLAKAVQGLFSSPKRTENIIKQMSKGASRTDTKVISEFVERMQRVEGSNLYKSVEAYKEIANTLKATGPVSKDSSQGLIRSVFSERRPNIERRRKMGAISNVAGQDLLREAENVGIKRAFELPYTHGSRNVNLGALSVTGFLQAFGAPASALGLPIGAIAGAVNDVMGPAMYKRLLDMSMRPGFKRFEKAFSEAAKKSPYAVGLLHADLINRDDNYKNLFSNTKEQGLKIPER